MNRFRYMELAPVLYQCFEKRKKKKKKQRYQNLWKHDLYFHQSLHSGLI